MIKKTYNAKQIVFKEGEPGHCMYEIISGTVDVFTGYGTEKEKKLTTLEAGRIFGEMALVERNPRSATIVTGEEGAVLLEISDGELDLFLKEEPAQVKNIMASMSHRLRELTKDYLEVCNTIREMRDTDRKPDKRSEGLLSRIARFLSFSDAEEPASEEPKMFSEAVPKESVVGKGGYTEQKWAKGQVIFREGDPADCMYYLAFGNVDVYAGYGTEKQKLLTTLSEESFFGEMGLIENLPRSATIVADSNVVVTIVIREKDLNRLMTESPVMALLSMQHLSSRLRNMTEDYLGACRTLKRMAEAEQKDAPGLTDAQLREIETYITVSMMNSYYMLL